MASNNKKRSLIWNYFKISSDDERFVNCKLCSSKLSRGGSDPRSYGTSALTCHLRTKHTAEYVNYQKETAMIHQTIVVVTLSNVDYYSITNLVIVIYFYY
jgi:hypothetical protein